MDSEDLFGVFTSSPTTATATAESDKADEEVKRRKGQAKRIESINELESKEIEDDDANSENVTNEEKTEKKKPKESRESPKKQSKSSKSSNDGDRPAEIAGQKRSLTPDNGRANGTDGEDSKRRKEASTVPVVVDSFETEAYRDVKPSAGLQAGVLEDAPVRLGHQIRHEVALPAHARDTYKPLATEPPQNPARIYPFTLDPFQQYSINAIHRLESVLVSAHTSAGKTVVAEYAIAQSLKERQRVIYTSPIKALSNQKYRELLDEFGDVGLMTGDVTINPTASCLVMTTEILRSMLYRGSEVMREVAWVIFDEIHYMRDKERGVVWEETIILLPDKVRYVFLSATIPNAKQFAEWICKIHDQPCHVVYTDFRPVPLQHYLFPAASDGIYLVVDEKGAFREDNFQKAMGSLLSKSDDPASGDGRKDGKSRKGGKGQTPNSDVFKIVRMIMMKNFNPVIVFSFSKRECEHMALDMSKLDFNNEDEHDMVTKVFNSAMDSLSQSDKELPQIQHILPLLTRGIGIHHGGLLPILKEVTEVLFQEGLIKVLFATETFSMGLNMPAKTVVFTNVRKFDGKETRWISSGEYIQMSGRAGRRGLDDRGVVILMVDEKMEPDVAKGMVRGEPGRLESAFYLGYNMILNLMRVEGINPEFMLERCFKQFQNNSNVPILEKEQDVLQNKCDIMEIEDEDSISDYYNLRKQIDAYAEDMRKVIHHPSYCLQFLTPGRLVRVRTDEHDYGWAAVVDFQKRKLVEGSNKGAWERYVVDVLLYVSNVKSKLHSRRKTIKDIEPPKPDGQGQMEVISIFLSALDGLSQIRIYMPKDLRSPESRMMVKKAIDEVQRRFPDGIALLDPIENLRITDDSFKQLVRKIEVLEKRLLSHPMYLSPEFKQRYTEFQVKENLRNEIKQKKQEIATALSIMQLDELKARKRVLRRLGFTSQSDVIELKGRVACEISSSSELLLTELIFNGVFNDLTAEQCAALLACFVFEEKSEEVPKLKDDLANPLKKLHDTARMIAKIESESNMESLSEDDVVEKYKPHLMDAVYAWANGSTFQEVCKLTDAYEGSIIRSFRLLVELLRQMCQAAQTTGNDELKLKFEDAIGKLKRDIVFSPSLLLS